MTTRKTSKQTQSANAKTDTASKAKKVTQEATDATKNRCQIAEIRR